MTDDLLTSAEVAARLGLSVRRVQALAARRGVGRKLSGVRLFRPEELESLRPGPIGRPKGWRATHHLELEHD